MKKRWPEDYTGWTGGFDDLVDTAQAILKDRDPDARPLNNRLVRHYQSKGAVGRGQKEGRAALFGTSDLAAVLASKGLVNEGWTLRNAASLLSSATPQALTSLASPPTPTSGNEAMRVVQELLNPSSAHPSALQGGPFPHTGFLPGVLQGGYWPTGPQPAGFHSGAVDRVALGSAIAHRAMEASANSLQVVPDSFVPHAAAPDQKYETTAHLAPWLTLALNETDAASASTSDRERAAASLEQWARLLRSNV